MNILLLFKEAHVPTNAQYFNFILTSLSELRTQSEYPRDLLQQDFAVHYAHDPS